MTVPTHTAVDGGGATVAWFCRRDPTTWLRAWVRRRRGGAVSQCRKDRPAAVPPPPDLGALVQALPPQEVPVRNMSLTATPPKRERDCQYRAYSPECDALRPLATTNTTFIAVYEHRPARHVLEVLGWPFEALAIVEGEEFLVDHAVVAAPRSARLVIRLDASDRPRVVSLYRTETPALEACLRRFDKDGILDGSRPYTQAEAEEIQGHCVVRLVARVDGHRVRAPGRPPSYGEEWRTAVAPGPSREVIVEVVANNPRNTRFAVVIWRAGS